MKLSKTTEVKTFRAAVDACRGDVWLESPRGDKYNLKSIFSQYIALDALLSQHGDELELYCALSEDESNFFKFFHEHLEVL